MRLLLPDGAASWARSPASTRAARSCSPTARAARASSPARSRCAGLEQSLPRHARGDPRFPTRPRALMMRAGIGYRRRNDPRHRFRQQPHEVGRWSARAAGSRRASSPNAEIGTLAVRDWQNLPRPARARRRQRRRRGGARARRRSARALARCRSNGSPRPPKPAASSTAMRSRRSSARIAGPSLRRGAAARDRERCVSAADASSSTPAPR